MATLPLYTTTVVPATAALESLHHMLTKAKTHPEAANLPAVRLYPDMLPLASQVFFCGNFVQQIVQRLTKPPKSEEVPEWAKIEETATLDDLLARVELAQGLLATVAEEDLRPTDGSDRKEELSLGNGALILTVTPAQFVVGYLLPNLFFHLSVAYSILRMKGLELGKKDYLTPFLKDVVPPSWLGK
ncbi:hypothetical protein VTK26DRAFT_7788 [Humicola hyalothermophila]